MSYTPKEIPENVNVTATPALVNFGSLVIKVVIGLGLLYWSLGIAADWLVVHMSPATEQKLGQVLLPSQHAAPIAPPDRRLQYLQALIRALEPPGQPLRFPLTVNLVEAEDINAAILPGGQVLVTTGLLNAVESENELAFVLAHEMGHFAARDALKGVGRTLVFLTVAVITGIGTSETGIPGPVNGIGNVTQLHYSRQQETAADRYALAAVIRNYNHGNYSLSLFKRLQPLDPQPGQLRSIAEYFSTHPLPQSRIAALEGLAANEGWSMTGEVTPLPDWFPSKS